MHVSYVLVLQSVLDPRGSQVVIFRQTSSCCVGNLAFLPVSKMYRDPFLLKIFTLGCVSSLFQDLARSAVSPEVPAGFFSRLWSQR